jgi:serine protease 16
MKKKCLLIRFRILCQKRYWVNDTFFNGTGPVFLWIGGEGELDPLWIVLGQIVNYAKEFNGLVVSLEHRFYGKSRPTA